MEYSTRCGQSINKRNKNTENYDEWIEYIEDRPFNDQRYYISNEKLKKLDGILQLILKMELKNL